VRGFEREREGEGDRIEMNEMASWRGFAAALSAALLVVVVSGEACETCEYAAGNLGCYEGATGLLEEGAFEPAASRFSVAHDSPDDALAFSASLVDGEGGEPASYWHSIPTYAEERVTGMDGSEESSGGAVLVNFVPEIRRGAIGKLEIIKDVEGNPIKYDTKDVSNSAGEFLYKRPRYVAYGPSPFTYGAIPQTWENSLEPDPVTGIKGDNDPIDALDIGSAVPDIGFPYVAKVLGSLGLIDDNETDWKVVLINANDPDASKYDTIDDVPASVKETIFTYFRDKPAAVGDAPGIFWPGLTDAYVPQVWKGLEDTKQILENTKEEYAKLIGDCEKVKDLEFAYSGCA